MSRVAAADTGMEVRPVLQVFGKLAVMIILVNLYKKVFKHLAGKGAI